jgi:uncharacterized protein
MERVMYNTVLGAKPLQSDGRAFYYADYNFDGKKVYSNHRFPCCSGTLPQVAADYRINTYFHDPRGIYVNLYIPSSVRWVDDGAVIALRQAGDYPFDDSIHFELVTSAAKEFGLNFRIPEWAEGARIEVNGKQWTGVTMAGSFAAVSRLWRSGDRIDVSLPRKLRLETIDQKHTDTVALVCGPLVLFAIRQNDIARSITRAELLAAKQDGDQVWKTGDSRNSVKLLPYVAIDDQRYSTYLRVT